MATQNDVPEAGQTGRTADVAALIDDTPISPRQWAIIVLCALMAMLDGFDVQAIAFSAPEIRREWGLDAAAMGPIFSAGLFGGMIGGVLMGPLGDQIGPKRVLVVSCIAFSITTLATVFTTDLLSLTILRAVTGLGLGAAVPAIVTILSAYAPQRVRATIVTGAFCLQLLGAAVGGAFSARLMGEFGWRSVFILGGAAPLVLLPLVMLFVLEPLPYLAARAGGESRVGRAVARLGKAVPGAASYTVTLPSARRNSAIGVFSDGRGVATGLLLLTSLVGGMFFYFLVSWLPSILRDAGRSMEVAVMGSVALNAGGLLGALSFGWLMDRYKPYVIMTVGYVFGALFVTAVTFGDHGEAVLLALLFATAFFGLGAQYCIPAAVVLLLPASYHGAGIGFALGATRIGAVVAPLIGSYILLQGGDSGNLFQFSAVCALGAAAVIFTAHIVKMRAQAAAAAAKS